MSGRPTVGVGVGVFVFNSTDQFIIGRRKGSTGAGTYALPGGHLEPGEQFEECAAREVLEEAGLEVEGLRFLTAVNTVNMWDPKAGEPRHYVTVFMTCRAKDGRAQPQVSALEPAWMDTALIHV